MRELGLIEPLVVYPQSNSSSDYLLLDGHIRLQILKNLGAASAKCLIAIDDEAFTYNHKVNRLNAIQEHFMILRVIKNGVSEERMARTLHVDVAPIRQKRDLLDGICAECVQLLKEKAITTNSLRETRKLTAMRQIEIAELMCATHTFTSGYVKCLVAATPAAQLVDAERCKEQKGLSIDDIARIENEMTNLATEFKLIEETHGQNALKLVVVVEYMRKLLENNRVVKFLTQRYPEIQAEFRKIVDAKSLADAMEA